MFFKSPQFVKGVKIFGYGLASFFLYRLTSKIYLEYTKKKITNEDDEIKEIPYTYKYYEEFEKFPVIELSKERIKSLLNNVLFEATPKGNVIMYYDYDKESFNYYCDMKDISYLYLETVVRKYAINFNCKKLVVNIQKEIENATNKLKDSEVKDKDLVKVCSKLSVIRSGIKRILISWKSANSEIVRLCIARQTKRCRTILSDVVS